MTVAIIRDAACFEGRQLVCRHLSAATGVAMTFGLFLPPQALTQTVPLLVYLSGLTCTWENATVKAGMQRVASQLGMAILTPDTSPRGEMVPDADEFYLGHGAGFYLNATQLPWRQHYQMEDYVLQDLPSALADFPVAQTRWGLCGHSMGGHGALRLGLKHPHRFGALSAFSPVVALSQCEWGQAALATYLGGNPEEWVEYDIPHLLIQTDYQGDILIHQGEQDEFLHTQLGFERLQSAPQRAGIDWQLHLKAGYDHSYYFVSTFMETHLLFHHRAWLAAH